MVATRDHLPDLSALLPGTPNGDGIGDLEGVRRRLDHLAMLGIDTIWLSPIFPSPMADFGYDVADYGDIDGRFGTMADFDRLISRCPRHAGCD